MTLANLRYRDLSEIRKGQSREDKDSTRKTTETGLPLRPDQIRRFFHVDSLCSVEPNYIYEISTMAPRWEFLP